MVKLIEMIFRRNIKFLIWVLFLLLLSNVLTAQEALKSIEEEYFDFLALQGITGRPALNYRTLSDSVWNIDKTVEHPWQNQKLGTFFPLFGDFRIRIYGPELFMSYNTAAPYGQNDGVLWQGRGLNSSLTSGIRFEGYGIELTLKPKLAFSQNVPFDIMPSNYDSEYGYFWGYSHNVGADAPQRFGNEPLFAFDWGDTEIRYSWKTLTAGFGTQAIWLGPAYLNPILHSNNAPSYPKFDIGLRRQRVTIPWLGWYLGDVEARFWVGRLSESDFFDNDDSNNYTMIHGLAFAYAPSFLPGLTIFANRVCLVPWAWENLKYILPNDENSIEDQKASFGFSWIFPKVGFEIYGEIGVDDFIPDGLIGYIRHPFHTNVYTAGLKKALKIVPEKSINGEIIFEFNWMEMTQTFFYQGHLVSYSFYMHHQLTHGYTNKGQWLGNGSSPMGNSQILKFILYYPKGNSQIILARNNPDTNYVITHGGHDNNYWANFIAGLQTVYFINSSVLLAGGFIYNLIIDQYNHRDPITNDNTLIHNLSLQFSVKLNY
jgi:hypothetical protein